MRNEIVNFNRDQQAAVNFYEGQAMVLAGPGSGKTTVMNYRIKNLITQYNVPPEDILVVTFTRMAASNMKKKFLEIMRREKKNADASLVSFGTFHSIYYRILRESGEYRGTEIIDDRKKREILKEVVVRNKINPGVLGEFIESLISEISRIKGNMEDDGYVPLCCSREKFLIIYEQYEKELRLGRLMDFDDILLFCKKYLLNDNAALVRYRRMFKFILIDEFQDINLIQYEIIKLLAAPEDNIFIVGDDDQSIYGFRGSRPDIMFRFREDYPGLKEIYLKVNYRSTQAVVDCSLNLIRNNKIRFEKKFRANNGEGLFPNIRRFKNQSDELIYMSKRMEKFHNEGMAYEDMAVLVRNNIQSASVLDILRSNSIDTSERKDKSYLYNSQLAKDILAYMDAALTMDEIPPKSNESLFRIVNRPDRCISRQMLMECGSTFENLINTYARYPEIERGVRKLCFDLGMIKSLSPYPAIVYIRKGCGYDRYIKQTAASSEIMTRTFEEFGELMEDATKFCDIRSFLEYANTEKTRKNKRKDEDKKGVNVMTMHASKGLEFKAVFLPDINQGVIPSSRACRENDLEEERRVMYVAMTRSAYFLDIYSVAEKLGCPVEGSVFIGEIAGDIEGSST